MDMGRNFEQAGAKYVRPEDRPESKLTPNNVTVQGPDGNVPLYYALLPNPNALTIKSNESEEARLQLTELIATDPAKVLSCQDKTLDEARRILLGNPSIN
jgi:hypothetical protein